MADLKKIQEQVFQNKVDKGFNTTSIDREFCYMQSEMAEAYDAWLKGRDNVGEELADIMIYVLGVAEILGLNMEDELPKKILKNSKRKYKIVDGVAIRIKEADS